MQKNTLKKRFSIQKRMILIFGTLIVIALTLLAYFAARSARLAVMEKVEAHLKDKAQDTAVILEGDILQWFEYLDGIASQADLQDKNISYYEKARILTELANKDKDIVNFIIVDTNGIRYLPDGSTLDVSGLQWFKDSNRGEKRVCSAPFFSLQTGKLVLSIAVPIREHDGTVSAILAGILDGLSLCDDVEPIRVGKTGGCYMTDKAGVTIGSRYRELVTNMYNPMEDAKTNKQHATVAAFVKKAVESNETEVGYYTFKGSKNIASAAVMQTTGWNVFIEAPVKEFTGTVDSLRIGILIGHL
ncbi:MAG: cache domain-containing protein [Treponemataceae bacterium]